MLFKLITEGPASSVTVKAWLFNRLSRTVHHLIYAVFNCYWPSTACGMCISKTQYTKEDNEDEDRDIEFEQSYMDV